jgi:hypothetical protein
MKNLKIGDRVNVETNVTCEWQSKYECKNAIVKEVHERYALIGADKDTIYSRNGNTPLGILYYGGYLITKIE